MHPTVCSVVSVMQISALATFIVHKDTCNFVTESEAVKSVNVKQTYPLIVLSICIDKLHGFTDLCVYKLIFFGRFDMASARRKRESKNTKQETKRLRAATNESQKTLNKCETRNKTVFHTRLRHPETINSVSLNSVLRINQMGV